MKPKRRKLQWCASSLVLAGALLLAVGLALGSQAQGDLAQTRITVASASNRDSIRASLNADGTLVAFQSDSDLLGQGIPDEQWEVWLYDTVAMTYTRVTTASESNRVSAFPQLSADGTKLAFSSESDFFGQGIADEQWEVWLYDVATRDLARITTASDSNRESWAEDLSADGTVIAIASESDLLGQDIADDQWEIWLYDTVALTYTRVTSASDPQRDSWSPSLSDDGTLVAFFSDSDILGQGIADEQFEIWLYDTIALTYTRITSASHSGRGSFGPVLSADGTKLAFTSDSDFFGQGIPQYQYEAWLYDIATGNLTRVTTAAGSGGGCDNVSLNADGSRLVCSSDSDYLGQGLPAGQDEIWLYDMPSAQLSRVTYASPPQRDSWQPVLSDDGTLVAFESDSDFLGEGNVADNQTEIWLFELPGPAPSLVKTVNDVAPQPGQRITFTLGLVNPFKSDLTGVVVSDTLPPGLTLAGPVLLEPPQAGAVLADDPGELPILASGLNVSATSAITLTFPVTVSQGVVVGSVITNTASFTSAQIPTPTLGSVAFQVFLRVSLADPPPNSHVAAPGTNLTLVAGDALSATSVTSRTFVVHGGFQGRLGGVFVAGSASFGPDSVAFDPDSDLHPGEVVQASVTSGVLSDAGVSLTPYVWEFRAATQGGAGVFSPHPATPALSTYQTSDVALGDLDGDGDLDVLLPSSGAETVWLNDGAGGLTPHPTTPSFGADSSSRDAVLGDLNGDGSLDALVVNALTDTVWLNDGAGNMTPHPTTPEFDTGAGSYDLALGDIDGDGDLDALVPHQDGADSVWVNDGAGNLSPHPTTPAFGEGDSVDVELGDVDGDGDLDAVVTHDDKANSVWVNDGAGNFSPHYTFGSRDCNGLALGDLDGDGDLDAIAVYYDWPSAVWLNDGAGHFATHPTTPEFGTGESRAVALGDVDGDGDLDALVARPNELSQTVWLNDGAGNLTAGTGFGAGISSGLALGDLDGDGDLDVVVSDNSGLDTTVWLNKKYEVMLPLILVSLTGTAVP
jgi:uncharacterized repeat protein (TIGR01451 family)